MLISWDLLLEKKEKREFVVVRKLQDFGVGFTSSAESFGQKKGKKIISSIDFLFFKTHQYQKILHFISLVVKKLGITFFVFLKWVKSKVILYKILIEFDCFNYFRIFCVAWKNFTHSSFLGGRQKVLLTKNSRGGILYLWAQPLFKMVFNTEWKRRGRWA